MRPIRRSPYRCRAAALGHVGVELLAVLGPLQLLDEVAEVAGFLVELAALFLEALELAAAIIVESRIAGAGEAAEAGGAAGSEEVILGTAEGVIQEGLGLVVFRISTHFPHQIGQRERPDEDEAQDDAGDLQTAAGLAPAAAVSALVPGPRVRARIPGGGGRIRHREGSYVNANNINMRIDFGAFKRAYLLRKIGLAAP